MFETLTKGFRAARQRLSGLAELDEENIEQALRDVRLSLLEADVEFNVVKRFLAAVKEKAVGEVIQTSATIKGQKVKVGPAERFIKICHDELISMMSSEGDPLTFAPKPGITGILMVGLQGTGKTTQTAKLARLLLNDGKKPLLVAADLQRPGAVEQLKVMGEKAGVPVFAPSPGALEDAGINAGDPVEVCRSAREEARKLKCDVILYDTAGRLAIDDTLMNELQRIKTATEPQNILLVVDAMVGQDSVKTAAAFHTRLGVTGVMLTKLDGDARGGAALSIKEVTGAPIRFAGMGEAIDKLEPFRPEGMASRILGFGDVVGLMKDFEGVIDEEKAQADAAKMLQGRFSLDDFLSQIRMIKQLGPLKDIFEKLPFFSEGMPEGLNLDDGELVKAEAIVSSMTKRERVETELFAKQPTRVTRVAKGSGRKEEDVKELIERFGFMREMMGNLGQQTGLLSKLPGMKQLGNLKRMRGALKGLGGGLPGMKGGFPGMPGGFPGGFPGMPPGMKGLPGMPPGMEGMPNMEEMLAGMGGPGGPDLDALLSSLGGGKTPAAKKPVDKQKKKNLRKMQKKSRKKGR
jgi:signal recognition particle subunit SRP54